MLVFRKYIFYPLVLFICIVAIGEVVIGRVQDQIIRKEWAHFESVSSSLAQVLHQNVIAGVSATNTLEVMLRLSDFDVSNFDFWAREILSLNKNVRTVQLAPKGVVTYIYPMTGNEGAVGHNLLADPKRRKGAMQAIEEERIIFVGPVKLIQNGKQAVIARKPIVQTRGDKKEFWGFAIALIYIEDIMNNSIAALMQENVRYSLYGSNPDSAVPALIGRSELPLTEEQKTYPITVPNGEWELVLGFEGAKSNVAILFHLALFSVAFLLAGIVYTSEKRAYLQGMQLQALNDELQALANTDMLTGLANRRAGMEFGVKQFALAKRSDMPYALGMLDIDHFKNINDELGHDAGDLALQHFVKTCLWGLRESDLLARWGGEEFVLFMPNTDSDGAESVARKIRTLVQDKPFVYKDRVVEMSVSIGVTASSRHDASFESMLRRADKALYLAQINGRNRCEAVL